MARKAPAQAEQSDAPVTVSRIVSRDRDGVRYPALAMEGEAPRKGSLLRVQLADGVVYSGRVAGHYDDNGQMMVETDGLTPEQPSEPTPE